MKLCYRHGLPVVPFGGGTSLEGQTLSPRKGVSIDFKNMKGCLDLNVKVSMLRYI
jgi:D-lactate dehydrogenase (cytochrome)